MTAALPLAVRLRRALAIALVLGLWAPAKVAWETAIEHQQNALRYRGVTLTRSLRDELGQGMSIGVLAGMRSVVADGVWLLVTVAWEHQDWFRMGGYINLCTTLQPRSVTFWDLGGWEMAWNASIDAADDIRVPSPMRRLRASRFWIQKGLEIYLRGIENNPEHYQLWFSTAQLYQQRLGDYRKAAYYYAEAAKRPDAPIFVERFPAVMYERASDDQAAYQGLARSLVPADPGPARAAGPLERENHRAPARPGEQA